MEGRRRMKVCDWGGGLGFFGGFGGRGIRTRQAVQRRRRGGWRMRRQKW